MLWLTGVFDWLLQDALSRLDHLGLLDCRSKVTNSRWSSDSFNCIMGMSELKKDCRGVNVSVYRVFVYAIPFFFKFPCMFCGRLIK